MTTDSKQAGDLTDAVTEKNVKLEEIKPEEDDASHSCRTFVIHNEDHTLGNSLRYVVMKDPRVEFCGYSVPHPSEDKINFRIQTDTTCTAEDALRMGLDNLQQATEVVLKKFENAMAKHKKQTDAADTESMDQS